MLRVIVLAIALTVGVVLAGDDHQKCGRLLHPKSMDCCKNFVMRPPTDIDDLKECFEIKPSHHSCEHDICIGKKKGYAADDGTVDMDAWEKVMSEDLKANPSLVEAIKDNCIKGDVSKYGPSDACLLMKLKMCAHKALVLDCKEWSDDGQCTGMKDLVRECGKQDE